VRKRHGAGKSRGRETYGARTVARKSVADRKRPAGKSGRCDHRRDMPDAMFFLNDQRTTNADRRARIDEPLLVRAVSAVSNGCV